jgi:hypothetical protein
MRIQSLTIELACDALAMFAGMSIRIIELAWDGLRGEAGKFEVTEELRLKDDELQVNFTALHHNLN